MSSSFKSSSGGGGGSGARVIHQDFIARIRYSNALPPPAIPPKLLDIPNTGLSSGQYTTPGFASRLAREQPLNIEADAELGMPLDLVGMPGIFDGDESSIQAPSELPPVHAHDKALLRPLATLSRAKSGDEPVSFLRRTEYISSAVRRSTGGGLNPSGRPGGPPKKRPAPEADDSPAAIRRKIMREFEAGRKWIDNLATVKNPHSKRNIKVVDGFSFLPDLDAFPDAGAYVEVKFGNNPVKSKTKYDERLLNGALKPCEKSPAEEAAYNNAMELWERDPHNNSRPPPFMNYDFYLHENADDTPRFRAKFDVDNPENEEEGLYTARGESGPCFQFTRLRGYETTKEVEMDHKTKYDTQLFVGYTDEDDMEGPKAAWYYPVMQKSVIRPQRQKRIDLTRGLDADDGQTVVDQLEVTVEDPTDELREHIMKFKEHPRGWDEEEEEEDEGVNGADGERESQRERERAATSDEDDADGDDDE
ncbi:related to DNA-directed RNA polymerase II regulator [Cephalotrichum gorgonifer]|uniref:Related to DNA-directed RNA polymerase II regulator n=1 Tax=Cephalotrichum gorgonifer TaxID=2041049 RepID=A0AAE8SX60_9PEZI|nr:related to DNA-directed RNA polymerase II regulator [Cephalotrichum gorgonifer]